MKALVTGGGGFLGTPIVRMLHEQGHDVTALGHGRYPHHERAGIRTIQADLVDRSAITRACDGMDIVFHVAALTDLWGRRKKFRAVNVEGTRHVIEACRRHGVGKLVYTSTPSVVFGGTDLCGVDESQPYPARYLAAYPETKAAAERMVLAANGPELATVALRPHLIWGPGDPHLIPRVIARARQGKLVQVGDGSNLVDLIYIDNAAEAHLKAAGALEPGAPCAGRAYFLSQGEPVRLWAWLNALLEAIGLPRIRRSISFSTAYRLGAVIETLNRILGIPREPKMTRFMSTQLAQSHYFNISAARRDFGFAPTISTAQGVDRLVQWLGQQDDARAETA